MISCFAFAQLPDFSFYCTMTISHDEGGNTDDCTIAVSSSFDELDETFSSSKLFPSTLLPENLFIYAYYKTEKKDQWSVIATDSWKNKYFSIITNAISTNYKITLSDIINTTGLELRFEDLVEDTTIVVAEGATYEFTAPISTTFEKRFRFIGPFSPDPGELAVCVYFNEIQINNNPYTTDIVVKDAEGNVVLTKTARATPQIISLENLASGHYFLEIGTESFEFCNKPEAK